jgi:hypothetical protein
MACYGAVSLIGRILLGAFGVLLALYGCALGRGVVAEGALIPWIALPMGAIGLGAALLWVAIRGDTSLVWRLVAELLSAMR